MNLTGNERPVRIVALGGAALVLLSGWVAARSPVAAALREGRPLAGVLLGTDWVDFARHSDTLMAWRYHPGRARLDVVSIPRDTQVDLPGYKFRRVNEIFSYHFGVSRDAGQAAGAVMEAVSVLLASPEASISPRYYVHVDYDGFRKIVDLLGGVEARIDEPLHYDDNAGDYHFHMEPGAYLLNGGEALNYVRFRGRSGDRGRIFRQMEFLKAFADRLSNPLVFIRWPRIVLTAFQSLHTNLSVWDMLFLVVEGRRLRPDAVHPWLLPGRPRGAYWVMDPERAALMLNQLTAGGEAASATAPAEGEAVTVKVWNGTARGGLALKATRRLRAAGFDVLEWGNYNGRQYRTRVLDRMGDIEKARSVARAVGTDFVLSEVNPRVQADVEVVLGDDYQ